MLKMERMTNSLSDPYTTQESRKTTMVNLYMLENLRKMREAEVQRHLAQSILLREAMKLKQRSSMRERIALLLIATAERLAPAIHESHVRQASQPTMARCQMAQV